jgi:hypothetical protein
MKAYVGVDVHIHIFLTSALVGGEWSTSRPGRFTPGERAPCTHWIGGWVDLRASLDDLRRENSWPYRDSNSDPSVVQPVASRYTDYAIPAPQIQKDRKFKFSIFFCLAIRKIINIKLTSITVHINSTMTDDFIGMIKTFILTGQTVVK